jgi:hypothetical protein
MLLGKFKVKQPTRHCRCYKSINDRFDIFIYRNGSQKKKNVSKPFYISSKGDTDGVKTGSATMFHGSGTTFA